MEHMLQKLREFLWVILLPISFVWAWVARIRRKVHARGYQSKLPIICVGNIHSGGSLKTPLVMAIAEHYKHKNPIIISRGYKGTLKGEVQSLEYGDEPWMMKERLGVPVIVEQSRVKAVRLVEKKYPDSFVVLDDGFQHLALDRSLNLVAINTDQLLKDSFCLPFGDLREPLSALEKSDAILLIKGASDYAYEDWKDFVSTHYSDKPVFTVIPCFEGIWDQEKRLSSPPRELRGFCGVAKPKRFIEEVQALPGGEFLKSFPDHYAYDKKDVLELIEEKNKMGGEGFVTTEKDWYKVKDFFDAAGEKLYRSRMKCELPEDFWRYIERGMAWAS